MERAWRLPVAATFQRHVDWQSNGSRCGPAAVANAYRSLGEAARTEGKVLAGTWSCWTGICIMGLSLDELAAVAQTNTSRKVTVLRDLSESQFLEHLRRSNDPGRRYIVNFDRARIFGAGSGHHSPIGGYFRSRGPRFRARCQLQLSAVAGRTEAAVRRLEYVRWRQEAGAAVHRVMFHCMSPVGPNAKHCLLQWAQRHSKQPLSQSTIGQDWPR
ncbi:hypothetical protein ACVIU7_005671 [Bradyrhizobium liaoningense]